LLEETKAPTSTLGELKGSKWVVEACTEAEKTP
jgi:hypothetical protein